MDKKVTEIRSSIDDIHLTSKLLLKRLNKITNDGRGQCKCQHECEETEKEIRKLQSHMKSLEDKVRTRNESPQGNDIKMMVDRLDVLEREFKLLESVDSLSRNASRNTQSDTSLSDTQNNHETNELEKQVNKGEAETIYSRSSTERHPNSASTCGSAPKTVQLLDESEVTKTNDDRVIEDKITDNVRKNGNISKNVEQKSEDAGKTDTGRQNKSRIESNIAIRRPNFRKSEHSAGLIKQDMKLVYDGESHWRSEAQNELDQYRTRYMFLQGVHTVICLDISESMTNSNAWTEARFFISDYLAGLEHMSKSHPTDIKTEYVALVTFGHQTKIQIGYTENFRDIEKELDKTKLGGPTQMYGGILMALAAAWCSGHQIERLDNCTHIFTKIILISDGRPTEDQLIAGPDIADSSKIDDTKAKILQEMENLRKNNMDLFFVPVGKPDYEFHRTMADVSGGFLLDYRQGKRFSKRQHLTSLLLDPIGLVAGTATRDFDNGISEEDREDLVSIQASQKRHSDEHARVGNNFGVDVYNETKSKTLPTVGSRVRRGPDWHYNIQDSNGPGTVIGQDDDDENVWVEWDANGHQNVYSYGPNGYDVLIVDEPRKLRAGEKIAVGCKVEPGKDWKNTGGNVSIGVVIKVDKNKKKVKVRWNNGRRNSYSYDDLQEIQVKAEGATSGGKSRVKDMSSRQTNDLESPQAMTIEEFSAKQKAKRNKNIK